MNTAAATGFSGTVRGRRALRGFAVERLIYRAGQVVPAHHHALPAVIVLVSGRCKLCNDIRRDLPCGPGAAIIHPAGELHSYSYEPDCDSQMLAVTFEAQSCDRFGFSLDLMRPRVTGGANIAPLTLRLRHCIEQPRTSGLSLEAAVYELLEQLCGTRTESFATPSLAPVRDLLHDVFKEPLSLAGIARTADLSPVQLERHFRRQFGCTLAAYVRSLRLAYARERLASSSQPIVNLAQELGFFDQSHFCHAFKEQFGISPTAYRRQCRSH